MDNVTPIDAARPKVLEFFAGIGLARLGLEKAGFRVEWANDFEPAKKAMYDAQFRRDGTHDFTLGDIGTVHVSDLPRRSSLAWASSPCTDLSLAGARAGLDGSKSGSFWHFVRLLRELGDERPEVVVLENVVGLATSHGGDDLTSVVRAFNELGYSVDVLVLDARRFVPQSRPRLFLVGAMNPPADDPVQGLDLRPDWLQWVYSDKSLQTHRACLPTPPQPLGEGLGSLIEEMKPNDERWWDQQRTAAFVGSLSPTQNKRLMELSKTSGFKYRTAYRRTRNGVAVWEARADDISGCLRTARGGSSKQAVVKAGNSKLKVRWMTPLEYARLMGAEDYNLSGARTNQVLFGFGDAVVVPAVAWLAEHYLLPLVQGCMNSRVDSKQAKRG